MPSGCSAGRGALAVTSPSRSGCPCATVKHSGPRSSSPSIHQRRAWQGCERTAFAIGLIFAAFKGPVNDVISSRRVLMQLRQTRVGEVIATNPPCDLTLKLGACKCLSERCQSLQRVHDLGCLDALWDAPEADLPATFLQLRNQWYHMCHVHPRGGRHVMTMQLQYSTQFGMQLLGQARMKD